MLCWVLSGRPLSNPPLAISLSMRWELHGTTETVHPDTQEARIHPGLPLGPVGPLPQLRQTFTNRVCTPGLMLQDSWIYGVQYAWVKKCPPNSCLPENPECTLLGNRVFADVISWDEITPDSVSLNPLTGVHIGRETQGEDYVRTEAEIEWWSRNPRHT